MTSLTKTPCTSDARLATPGRRPVRIALLATVRLWARRARDRRRLHDLPEYLLRDMGITRDVARIESAKPFWRG